MLYATVFSSYVKSISKLTAPLLDITAGLLVSSRVLSIKNEETSCGTVVVALVVVVVVSLQTNSGQGQPFGQFA